MQLKSGEFPLQTPCVQAYRNVDWIFWITGRTLCPGAESCCIVAFLLFGISLVSLIARKYMGRIFSYTLPSIASFSGHTYSCVTPLAVIPPATIIFSGCFGTP